MNERSQTNATVWMCTATSAPTSASETMYQQADDFQNVACGANIIWVSVNSSTEEGLAAWAVAFRWLPPLQRLRLYLGERLANNHSKLIRLSGGFTYTIKNKRTYEKWQHVEKHNVALLWKITVLLAWEQKWNTACKNNGGAATCLHLFCSYNGNPFGISYKEKWVSVCVKGVWLKTIIHFKCYVLIYKLFNSTPTIQQQNFENAQKCANINM